VNDIRWYTIGPDLEIRERGPLELPHALDVVDKHFSILKAHYSSGEQAIAATTFGFARSEDDFIEICVHSADNVSFTTELPASGGWLNRLRGTFRRELKLASRDALRALVTSYFTITQDEFRSRLA